MSPDPKQAQIDALRAQVERLTRMNHALMDRVERTVDGSGSAFALFEANVLMQKTINERTAALNQLNESLRKEVCDRTRAEELMRQARDQATAASATKSQFLANMSHEIRTPLTAVIGYAEILRDQEWQSMERREYVETICRNGSHLLALVNDILDITRLDAGQLRLERLVVRPLEVLDEVCELLRVRADGKGLRLEIEREWPLPRTIMGDPMRIRQILLNVVGNAIKFTECGGVRVHARSTVWQDEPAMRFDVIDTGIGMTQDVIDRLFRPFHQADASMARRFGGAGLGLAISRELARLMGGEIETRSTPGTGSTFSITLPVGMATAEPDLPVPTNPIAHADKPAGALQGVRVLVAEDGPDNQRLIRHHLTRAGADVTVVENGLLALDAVESGAEFDLVLMDMQMPEMDGYTATRTLRERGRTLPIIALTAHAIAGDRERCLDAGCDEYLTKPIDRATLIARIRARIGASAPHPA
ncbi:MAG: ATP-binding protein [Phycisphaerales bacterium]|jgi:signal transduction histidine kinase/ActR/RegA family two-component response regulator|nr:ATP-binding protein [Phycisphaerales bacterium]